MAGGLEIRDDLSADDLRRLARRESGRTAARMYAIANALDGMSRAEAARLAGMDRQALRDAVVRYNAEGLGGLHDRPKGRPPRRLTEGEEATLAAVILRGPDPERDGVCAWTRPDLCRWMAAHFGKTYHPSSLTRVLRRLAFSRQKARPVHPQGDPSAAALPKKGLRTALTAVAEAHPTKRLQLWFQDEARIGNKGRVCHRWWLRGQRPPGLCDRRYQWTYIFSAVRPATGDDFTLVLPEVSTRATRLFFDAFAGALPEDVHAVVVLDGAGWHQLRPADLPANLTLVTLPPYSPELNPVERVWLYLRERFLSLRLLDDTEAIIDACCDAWNALTDEPRRLQSLCAYPWIMRVAS